MVICVMLLGAGGKDAGGCGSGGVGGLVAAARCCRSCLRRWRRTRDVVDMLDSAVVIDGCRQGGCASGSGGLK